MRFFNRCVECDVRIPWRTRTVFGSSVKPVVCRSCSDASVARVFGTLAAGRLAMLRAEIELRAKGML